MSEDYNFVNVKNEPNRTSDVWNYFLLDKKREVAKCEACFEKHKITKILVATKGCSLRVKNSSGLGETRDIRNTRRSGTGQVGLDLLDLGVPRGRSPKSLEGIGQVGY